MNSQEQLEENMDMTMSEHAEAWHKENGGQIPTRDTLEWDEMYQKWVEFAFDKESFPYSD